ncbi:hypothetical protein ACR6HW_04685 [Fusibacter sp. JL298sf-3]
MKKRLCILCVLVLVFNLCAVAFAADDTWVKIESASQRYYVLKDTQGDLEVVEQRSVHDMSIEGYQYDGYIDIDYWFDKSGSTTYELYMTIKSDKYLTNSVQGNFTVKDTSIFSSDTYLNKWLSKSYTASKRHNQSVGRFTARDVERVKLSQSNMKIYNLSKATWVNFGSWSGSFSLPKW